MKMWIHNDIGKECKSKRVDALVHKKKEVLDNKKMFGIITDPHQQVAILHFKTKDCKWY